MFSLVAASPSLSPDFTMFGSFLYVLPSVQACEHLVGTRRARQGADSPCLRHWPTLGFQQVMKNCSAFFFLLVGWMCLLSELAAVTLCSCCLLSFQPAWLPPCLGSPRGSTNCDLVVSSVFLVIVKVGAMFFPAFHILSGSLSVLFYSLSLLPFILLAVLFLLSVFFVVFSVLSFRFWHNTS